MYALKPGLNKVVNELNTDGNRRWRVFETVQKEVYKYTEKRSKRETRTTEELVYKITTCRKY